MGYVEPKGIWKVVTAASIGTFFDFYDFFIFGSAAAVVFPTLYFSFASASLAVALSIMSYGVSFLVRPFSAAIFGHLGDRLGRKRMLVYTLIVMGCGTLGVGVLPGYAAIGVTAPILLIVFRFVQGFGVGGEMGGSLGWILETASRSKHRGFLTGLVGSFLGVGSAGASAAFALVALLPSADFMNWGWRIPFYLGFFVLIVGLIIRYRLYESPLFEQMVQKKAVAKRPSVEVFQKYPKIMALLMLPGSYGCMTVLNSGLLSPYTTMYLTSGLKISMSLVFFAFSVGGLINVITGVLGAYLTDKFGRKVANYVPMVGYIVCIVPFFLMVGTAVPLIILLGYALIEFWHGINYGSAPPLISEQFPTAYRYSGTGLAQNLATMVGGIIGTFGFPVIIAAVGVLRAWYYLVPIFIVCCLVNIVSISRLKETKGASIE